MILYVPISKGSVRILTEYFKEAGAVGYRLVDNALLAAVPDPHVLGHVVHGAHV